jgi:DNA-binding GntR family transcriptional regulator
VSSTPIREALNRLAAEGLVSAAAFVGFAVAPLPSPKYFADLYAFRLVVEPWAAAEAARLRPTAALATMTAALRAMKAGSLSRQYRKSRGFLEADDQFHRAILDASGNEVARRSYEDLGVHLHASRLFITREQDARTTCEEHRAILASIEDGQPDAAAARMRGHLEASRRRLLD